jgi:hypothetical protein
VGAAGSGLSFLWILLSPQRHLRDMPEPVGEPEVSPELEGMAEALPSPGA